MGGGIEAHDVARGQQRAKKGKKGEKRGVDERVGSGDRVRDGLMKELRVIDPAIAKSLLEQAEKVGTAQKAVSGVPLDGERRDWC
jgi:hypothetical protein